MHGVHESGWWWMGQGSTGKTVHQASTWAPRVVRKLQAGDRHGCSFKCGVDGESQILGMDLHE